MARMSWKEPYDQSPYQDSGVRRVRLKHNLKSKGWNSRAHREFARNVESANLSRDILSRKIGRTGVCEINTRPTCGQCLTPPHPP